MLRCSPRDIRDSAAIGSPWVPVVISTTRSAAIISAAPMSITSSSATLQVAQLAGDAHVAHHRPADERHPPAQRHCGVDDLLHPIDIGGEARDDDPAFGAADQPVQRRADLAFRRSDARDLGIRRVAQEQVDAGVAEPRHARQVGGPAVERQLVELDVAGVQDSACAGVDRDGQAAGNRVVDREVLALEHAVRGCAALGDLDEHRLDAVLAALLGDQREGELRADDRNVRAAA